MPSQPLPCAETHQLGVHLSRGASPPPKIGVVLPQVPYDGFAGETTESLPTSTGSRMLRYGSRRQEYRLSRQIPGSQVDHSLEPVVRDAAMNTHA